MKTLFCLIALAAALAAGGARAQDFAVVEGTAIGAAEYDAALQTGARQKFYHRAVPEAQMDEYRREVAQSLIDRVLLLNEARRRGMVPDAARTAGQIAEYDQRYANSEQWKNTREATLPGLTKFLEERDILEQIERAVRGVEMPGEAELAAYYEGHRDLFTEPEQARLSLILLKVDPASPTAIWTAAQEEAAAIRRRLAAGADFAAAARLHSNDASAANGGDMGYLHEGMMPDGVYAHIALMKAGELSEPIRVLEGVALLRLEDRRSAKLRPLAEVTPRAAQLWQRGEGERRWSTLVAALRGAATVRIDTARYPALVGLYAAAQGAPRSQ